MKTTSRLLLACVTVILAASQADAGDVPVSGPGGYRYRNAPPPSHGYVQWRYQHRDWARRDWAPRYYAPQYQNDLGAAIAGALAGAALQLIPRATEALAARLPPAPGAPPPPPAAAAPPPPALPPVAAVPPPAVPPPAELAPGGDAPRCYSRQFGQRQPHHPRRDRGGPHRLVREPRRRAAVRQDAGAVKERFPFVTPRGGCDATSI